MFHLSGTVVWMMFHITARFVITYTCSHIMRANIYLHHLALYKILHAQL
jgi:hypothetical protein